MQPFPRFDPATTFDLSGLWSFAFVPDVPDPVKLDPAAVVCDDVITVPGVFDATPAYAGRRGTGVYKTKVSVETQRRSQLRFDGLGLWARLYVDGESLGDYDLPYVGWTVDVPASDRPIREITLVVDNRLDPQRTPLVEPYFDFYLYGGVYRGVWLRVLDGCAVEEVRVTVRAWKTGRISVVATVTDMPEEHPSLEIAFDEGEFSSVQEANWNKREVVFEAEVPDAQPWSPESPQLHTLRLRLKDDVFETRFGLREIRVDGPRLLLNDDPLILRGVCRHEAHPQFGPALPAAQLLQDVQLLKQMHCNFVRGSHYPQDPRFLDLCDELGILVFEESLGWEARLQHLESDHFGERLEAMTRQMVRRSFNHPSVIMWGFLNEGHSEMPESRPLYERLVSAIREEDPTRPVTFATNRLLNDVNLDLADIISTNCYPGWYAAPEDGVRPLDTIVPRIDQFLDHLKDKGLDDRPFLISEIGAGAIYGWHDPLNTHWSEEYQADLLQVVCDKCREDDRITGLSLWQFCDIRTYADSQALTRPRAFNNKGIYDEYRRPKLAVRTITQNFERWS